tara:strand:+ start:1924 stop:2082 length:159 start_codon:yes stop_codon:yes gene_type:complete
VDVTVLEIEDYTYEKSAAYCEATRTLFVLDIIHTVWNGYAFFGSLAADDLNS